MIYSAELLRSRFEEHFGYSSEGFTDEVLLKRAETNPNEFVHTMIEMFRKHLTATDVETSEMSPLQTLQFLYCIADMYLQGGTLDAALLSRLRLLVYLFGRCHEIDSDFMRKLGIVLGEYDLEYLEEMIA